MTDAEKRVFEAAREYRRAAYSECSDDDLSRNRMALFDAIVHHDAEAGAGGAIPAKTCEGCVDNRSDNPYLCDHCHFGSKWRAARLGVVCDPDKPKTCEGCRHGGGSIPGYTPNHIDPCTDDPLMNDDGTVESVDWHCIPCDLLPKADNWEAK